MQTVNMTREDALNRLKASMEKKKAYLAEMEASMRRRYKERTGQEAVSFNVW